MTEHSTQHHLERMAELPSFRGFSEKVWGDGTGSPPVDPLTGDQEYLRTIAVGLEDTVSDNGDGTFTHTLRPRDGRT